MITNINWVSFWIMIGWLLAGWYLLLGFYYAKDLRHVLQYRFNKFGKQQNKPVPGIEKTEDAFALAQHLRNEILDTLQQAAHWRNPKEEIIMALQIQVRGYPQLKDSAFEIAINNYIVQESEKQCSMPFSDEELRMIWVA